MRKSFFEVDYPVNGTVSNYLFVIVGENNSGCVAVFVRVVLGCFFNLVLILFAG